MSLNDPMFRERLLTESFKSAADEADAWKAENQRLVKEIGFLCEALGRIRDSVGKVSPSEIQELCEDALNHEEPRAVSPLCGRDR